MIKICRLTISTPAIDKNNRSMEEILHEAMIKAGVTMADIEVNIGTDWNNKSHFGNWCFLPILNNEKAQRLADMLGTKLDIFENILTKEDIAVLQIGDKVKINFLSDTFCFPVGEYGTVYSRAPDLSSITILKKGSKSKGWKKNVNEWVTIEKIAAFPKKVLTLV